MSIIEVKDLEKSFGDVTALNGVDMEISKGEVVGVLGPNGAGKSTLMKILTGQMEYDSGDVSVFGSDPVKHKVKIKERMGILPEREDPPSFLTGREYFEFVEDVRGTEFSVEDWKEKFNLDGKMDKVTLELSKGERQKLMIAQAFYHEPEIVFIDEPLVNLDPIIQEEAKDLFRERREAGGTVFLCTHVVSLAEALCDRVFFLKDGEVVDEITNVENLKEKFLEEE
ncbi:MAG: ABC transporter ATP-binding protein [Candidatus Nanosalina sp.]